MSFGKYKFQSIEKVFHDKYYYNWIIKQDFFKEQYPKLYEALKNYIEPKKNAVRKNINFFEMVEKNLNNDILGMIGDNLKANYGYSSFGMNSDYIKNEKNKKQLINVFKHRANLLEVIDNRKQIHMYRNTFTNNKIICNWNDQQDIRNRYIEQLEKEINVFIKKYDNHEISFGKYKGTSFFKFYNNDVKYLEVNTNRLFFESDLKRATEWKVKSYKQWLRDNMRNNKNYNLYMWYSNIKDALIIRRGCCYN